MDVQANSRANLIIFAVLLSRTWRPCCEPAGKRSRFKFLRVVSCKARADAGPPRPRYLRPYVGCSCSVVRPLHYARRLSWNAADILTLPVPADGASRAEWVLFASHLLPDDRIDISILIPSCSGIELGPARIHDEQDLWFLCRTLSVLRRASVAISALAIVTLAT